MARKRREAIWQSTENLTWDLWLAATAIGLTFFGLVMVYSASLASGKSTRQLMTQGAAALVGIGLMMMLRRVDYHFYARPLVVYGLLLGCIALLALVFLFQARQGAHRWIHISPFSLQPSELAKIAMVLFLAWFLALRESEKQLTDFWATIAPAGVVLGVLSALILPEPDLGTVAILCLITVTMLYVAGAPLKSLLLLAPVLVAGLAVMIWMKPYRLKRIQVFIFPELDPQGAGYNIRQALIALGSGGTRGLGLAQGKHKLSFLPEPESDFIFPVIGEELGLIGAGGLILVFGFLLWRGLRAAQRAEDTLGRLMAIGLTTWLIAQAFLNLSVALKLLPTKGITLPFISAGGSSLIAVLIAVGILMNISGHGSAAAGDETRARS